MSSSTPIQVPFVDLKAQFLSEEKDLVEIFKRVGASGNFILGDGVRRFEENFAKYCGTQFAVGVGNGSDSLFFVMKALGIGAGDEVITQPNSFIASAWAIVAAGATPVFVDVDDTQSIDVTRIQSALTSRTRAIIPVHLAGNPCNMNELESISANAGVFLIEDAAQAIGATYRNKPVGGFGIAGSFSLHPLKNLGVLGDGGVVTTNDPDLADRLRLLRNHGLRDRDHVEIWGYNSRIDELQAQIADYRLAKLDQANLRLKEIAKLYDAQLAELVRIPKSTPGASHVYHNYIINTQQRDELASFMKSRGIDTRIHYPIPIHLQKAASTLNYKSGSFPNAERHSEESLSLPIYPTLKHDQILKVTSTIREFSERASKI